MSDLSLQLQPALSQLPVSSYFDPSLFAREMESLFKPGTRYVGHALSVPEVGDYYALPQEQDLIARSEKSGGFLQGRYIPEKNSYWQGYGPIQVPTSFYG